VTIVVLGPGGVGGLLAGAFERSGEPVGVVAQDSTATLIAERGLRVQSHTLGSFTAWPRAEAAWGEPIETLVVATKASRLSTALERIEAQPDLVLPLLNGLDHLGVLRARFGREAVVASTIRVEANRPEPGVVLHTSPFLRVEMASSSPSALAPMKALAAKLEGAGVTVQVDEQASEHAEAQVMWSKLVRIAPLACMTSAYDATLGEIRAEPNLWRELEDAIGESCAVAEAEGADVEPAGPIGELEQAHASLGSSMQRDLAAGRPPELEAIP
jgi:2-dehydropantoate 2-reductase